MSIASIIALACSVFGAILGAILIHPISKSSGRREGAQEAQQEQQVTQAKAAVEAVQERSNVEQKTAASPDRDLDDSLSEFSRPD